MELRDYDEKCVRITDALGDVYEGRATYYNRDYVFHEYGCDQEALCLTPVMFYQDDIASIVSLEDINGPFGHYSERYGLLERTCLKEGTDLIGEVFDSEDNERILRMLYCLHDSFEPLADETVPGMAPWMELKNMLDTLVKNNQDDRVVNEAKKLLERIK